MDNSFTSISAEEDALSLEDVILATPRFIAIDEGDRISLELCEDIDSDAYLLTLDQAMLLIHRLAEKGSVVEIEA